MSKQKLTLAIVLFLVGCGVVAIALRGTYCQNADSPETPAEVKVVANATTAELLCDAQTKFDAWRLVESLETVTAIQPEKNEQNLPHYSEYIPDGDIEYLEVLEKNEFYQKDTFLAKLANRFLVNMQSEFAVTAARHIGQNDARNRTLASIVKAQLKAAETAQTNPPGDVDEMLDKAVLTASYVDSDSWKNTVFELLAIQMALSGRFLDAAEQAAKIPDNKKRNAALSDLTRRHVIVSRWYRSPGTSRYTVTRIEDRETAYKAIISHMDDPKVKSLALYNLAIYFGARNDQNNIISPKKCEEYLAASLDTLVAIENPGMREINILTRVAELYKELGMNEKAKSVRDLLNSRIADLEPGKRGGG